ncbi:thaumatin-like protein [Lenzites betulinus]|nr:thaumatin-like protein [Lenzites betulinus]
MKSFTSVVTLAMLIATGSATTLTVVNGCPFTICTPAIHRRGRRQRCPRSDDGWEQSASQSVSFSVSDNWKGRIWGRRDCDFSTLDKPGRTQCLTGGCDGGLECDPYTGTGAPPVTVADFTLGGQGDIDYYDVSLADGYNLPIRIDNSVGCPAASCPVDLASMCPSPLKGPVDSDGFVAGCNSACSAGIGDPINNPNCCTGTHVGPANCQPSGVAFYSYFKDNCPDSYAYAFDESSGTALWTCPSPMAADYTITFCP